MITQGKWEVSKHGTPDYAPQYGIRNSKGNDFCIVKGVSAEEDAHLIATAPKLLAVCERLVSAFDGSTDCTDILDMVGGKNSMVRQVIADAKNS